jgi:hypothetical protein
MDITTAKLFMHILDEIKEVGQEQFSLELYSVEKYHIFVHRG